MKKTLLLLLLILLLIPLTSARVIVTPEWPATGTAISIINLSSEQITAIPVEYDPAPAQPGQYVTLFLKLENPTQSPVQNSMFKIETGFPFSLRESESPFKSYGKISGGQQILLVYNLFVSENAKEDDYVIYLRSCTNKECTNGLKTPIEIAVRTGGEPKVEVGLEDSDILYHGTAGTATLHIINRGLLDTKFAVIELLPSKDYEIISPRRIYLGELESDDFETAEFKIYINGETDKTRELPLEIFVEYTDENNKEYSDTQAVMLKVYSQKDLTKFGLKEKSSSGSILVLIILVTIGAFYYYKKKKKNV